VASLLHLPDGDHVIAGTIALNQLTDGSSGNDTNASNYHHSYQYLYKCETFLVLM
jgi:hypothetical protein